MKTLYRCEHPFKEKKEITIGSLSLWRKEERKKEGKRNKCYNYITRIADVYLTKPKSGASLDSLIFIREVARGVVAQNKQQQT